MIVRRSTALSSTNTYIFWETIQSTSSWCLLGHANGLIRCYSVETQLIPLFKNVGPEFVHAEELAGPQLIRFLPPRTRLPTSLEKLYLVSGKVYFGFKARFLEYYHQRIKAGDWVLEFEEEYRERTYHCI